MGEETELASGGAPGPDASGGVAGFVTSLRALKIHTGNPSLKDLAKRSGVPRSTLADALNPERSGVPRLAVVTAFVEACGVTPQEALGWQRAWRAVQSAEDRRRINRLDGVGVGAGVTVGIAAFAGRAELLAARDALRTLIRALDLPDAT